MATKQQKSTSRQSKPPFTQNERDAFARYKSKSRSPYLKIEVDDGAMVVETSHANDAMGYVLLLEAVGGEDLQFLNGLIAQLTDAGVKGRDLNCRDANFMLSVVKSIRPQNQLEAMLAAQMAAVHLASMTMTRRLAHVETLDQQDSASRALTKLTRTYAMQMETLKRVRSKGEQKVTVEHVHVHEGGQAIVGTVATAGPDRAGGGGAAQKTRGQPHATASLPHHADEAFGDVDALTSGPPRPSMTEIGDERPT